ncbi:aldehyde dehydrogenase family protein [Rhizobium sp. BK068]|nr:aldehyde dehydrogenase family protein [Rhizobium sp. BK068]
MNPPFRKPTACLMALRPTRIPRRQSAALGRDMQSGMVSINHHGLALPELPFGGIKDSGYGSEGGTETMESFFNTKLVTETI